MSQRPFNEILVGAAVFASACISFWLTRAPNGIALIWPGAAIAAALLIRLPQVRWGIAVPAVLSGILLANLVVERPLWSVSAVFAAINGMESALMVAAFRFLWPYPYPNISINQAAVMTGAFGIAIPGLAAAAAGLVLHNHFSVSFTQGTLSWWSSHAIGACLVGPPIILFSFKELRRLTRGRLIVKNLLLFTAALGGCYLAIRYVRFPFVLIGLTLLIAAFRLGGFGTSILSLCVGLLLTNLWLLGIRPMGLDLAASASGSLVGLPVMALLASLMPPIAVGLGSDARRGAVRALRVSERLFHESMEHSPIGMLISDLNGVWVYTNIALQQMLGYTAAEFRALPPGGPSHPEEWKESEVRWARLLTGELQIYDTVRRFQHKDGHWIWTHVAVSLMRDEEATPLHLIAQIESLVARQLAEATLAEERERLRITLASISDAVVTTDADTRITYLNVAAETLLGLKLATVQTRRVNEVIHLVDPQSSKSAPNLMGQSVLHGQVFRREHPCLLHRPAALIAIDLVRFKALNDAAGHAAGDAMLRRVAETCRAAVRHTDTVARLGGDEFAIVLDNCSEARADIIGNQLLNALNALEIEWLGSRYTNGASLGLAMCTPEMIDQAAWLKCADDACYGAKHLGRGRLLAASRAQW